MNTYEYTPPKLVTDKKFENMEAEGQVVGYTVLEDDLVFRAALHQKVLEEAQEVTEAVNPEDIIKEVRDLHAVLWQLAILDGVNLSKYLAIPTDKKGAFSRRIFVTQISVREGSKWDVYYKDRPANFRKVKK